MRAPMPRHFISCVFRARALSSPLPVIPWTLIFLCQAGSPLRAPSPSHFIYCVFCERALSSFAYIILWILICLCQQGSPCAHRGRVISYLACSVCVCTQSAPPRHPSPQRFVGNYRTHAIARVPSALSLATRLNAAVRTQ